MSELNQDFQFVDLAVYFDEKDLTGSISNFKKLVGEKVLMAKNNVISDLDEIINYSGFKIEELEEEIKSDTDSSKVEELSQKITKLKSDIRLYRSRIKLLNNDINENFDNLTNEPKILSKPKYKIHLCFDRQEIFAYGDRIKELCKAFADVCKTEEISVEVYEIISEQSLGAPVNYTYTADEFKELLDLYNQVNKDAQSCGHKKIGMYFCDDYTVDAINFKNHISLEDVCRMNSEIDKICDYIREKQFTPYEAMIYIHNYLTSYEYVHAPEDEDHTDQMIVGPLLTKNKNIICSGYSSLCKAIVDRLNMPGLSCDYQSVGCFDVGGENIKNMGNHSICLIKIKDEKYKIYGEYYNDASDDNGITFNRYVHFLYPKMDNNFLIEQKMDSNFDITKYLESRVELPIKTRKEQIIGFDKYRLEAGHKDYDKCVEIIEKRKKLYNSKDEDELRKLIEEFKPIKVEQLIVGLYNVLEKCPEIKKEYDATTTKEAITNIIVASMISSIDTYRQEALNGFMRVWKDSGYFEAEDKKECAKNVKKNMKDLIGKIVNKLDQQMSDSDAFGR